MGLRHYEGYEGRPTFQNFNILFRIYNCETFHCIWSCCYHYIIIFTLADCVFLQKGDADSSDFPVSTLLGDLLNTSELGRVCHGIPCTWFPHRTKHHLPFNSWERLERTEKMGGLFWNTSGWNRLQCLWNSTWISSQANESCFNKFDVVASPNVQSFLDLFNMFNIRLIQQFVTWGWRHCCLCLKTLSLGLVLSSFNSHTSIHVLLDSQIKNIWINPSLPVFSHVSFNFWEQGWTENKAVENPQ